MPSPRSSASKSTSKSAPAKTPTPPTNTTKPAKKAKGTLPRVQAASASRVSLPGSHRPLFGDPPAKGSRRPSARRITVSVLLKRSAPLPSVSPAQGSTPTRLTRAQFRQQFGADPAAVKAVRSFATEFGLEFAATPAQLAARTVQLSGTRAQLEQAFSVSLTDREHSGTIYRVRVGDIQIPSELAGQIEAVLGLDDRPQAKAHFRLGHRPGKTAGKIRPAAAGSASFTPPQIAALYNFPTNASASGQTIGLIELGGDYRPADLSAYFSSLGITNPAITTVSVDGGKNAPTTADSADGEVMLDIEVAASVAPGAAIAVYFAPNTDQGFIDAVTTAVHDTTNKPSVLSISWGGPESSWTEQAYTALDSACQAAALLGVTITVAAGDNGSSDGVTDGSNHVDFPASSPHVLACGGTKITASGTTLTGEVVWNEQSSNEGATGGGVSSLFAKPSWQSTANVPAAPSGTSGGRGVPDVAGNADPVTGYTVRVDGETIPVGGTSAVAPLWAGLIALSNAQGKTPAGFCNAALYAAPKAFHDIMEGNNGSYSAAPGWDPCTGLGSPIGTSVIAALTGTVAPPITSGGGAGTTPTGTGTKGHKHHKGPGTTKKHKK